MISEAEARQVAEKALAQRGGGLVIVRTVEHDIGWEYAWQSLEYVETGDEMVMVIGTAPILVSRTDGSLIPTGIYRPIQFYIDHYKHRQAWRQAATEFDLLVTDTLDEMSVIGPTMKEPVIRRVAALHSHSLASAIDRALAHATIIGERAVELLHDVWDEEAKPRAARTLQHEYPSVYPPVWRDICNRAAYWWEWRI